MTLVLTERRTKRRVPERWLLTDERQMREGDSKKEAGQNIRSGSTAPGNRDQERRGEERGAPKGPGETQATGALPLIK